MQQVNAQRKTLTERVIHAISFEGLATLILAPTAAWLMQRSVVEMGGLSILLATLAMVWNIIYNALFDRLWPVSRVVRNLRVRALHAIGFESGFILIGVTMVALVLGVALRLDRQVGGIFSDAEYGEFVVDRGRRTQCLFQDGTVAHLNSESKIHYPVKFGLFERRIRLEGEAYFEVTHNPRRPFVVEFEGGEIQVLGTSFNVKAYRDDVIVAVTLDEGRVVLDDRRGGRFELSPSEQLLYDRRSGEGRIVRGADAMRYSIWKDDVISFRDTPLAEVLETLSRWYDVRFETDGQPDRPISYTFATDNTLLDNVLREMELISPVRFERTKTEIKVSFR